VNRFGEIRRAALSRFAKALAYGLKTGFCFNGYAACSGYRRQSYLKSSSLTYFALYLNGAVVLFDDIIDNREA
jgi:hypothetical protein